MGGAVINFSHSARVDTCLLSTRDGRKLHVKRSSQYNTDRDVAPESSQVRFEKILPAAAVHHQAHEPILIAPSIWNSDNLGIHMFGLVKSHVGQAYLIAKVVGDQEIFQVDSHYISSWTKSRSLELYIIRSILD